MRIVGAVSLILSILFFCAAVAMFAQSAHMENQVEGQSDFTKAASEFTGIADHNRAQIEGSSILGAVFMLGCLMLGGFGVVLIGISLLRKRDKSPFVAQKSH